MKNLYKLFFPFVLLFFGILFPLLSHAQCDAKFTFPQDSVCGGTALQFSNTSTGSGALSYLWNFGDASSPSNFSNVTNPSHNFIDTGLLVVKLIVTDASACSDTITDTVYVFKRPVASFTRYDNCKQTATKFTNATAEHYADPVVQWKWFFGTGDSSSAKNPQYTYPDTGKYNLKLIVYSNFGCIDTALQSLRVYSKPKITVADTQFCAASSVDFNVQLLESSGVTYLWRFGDGNSSVQKAPLYTYNTGGYFHPVIRVTHGGADSCFAQFDSITVYSLPVVNFSIPTDTFCYDANNACVNDLSASGTFGGGLWKRTVVYGDGFIDNTTPVSTHTVCHHYSDAAGGSYPISVEITDSNQCFNSKQVSGAIVILPDFTPAFSVAEEKDCFTTKVTITNTSTFDSTKVSRFKWTYGDTTAGDSTHWLTNQHLYTVSGSYPIKLTLTDTSGCPKTVNSSSSVQSVVLNFHPTVNKDTSCYWSNLFSVSNPVNNGAKPTWIYGDGGTDTAWVAGKNYNAPGNYIIKLRIQGPNCDTIATVKTVTVLGPRANMGIPLNRFQCQIHDTIYFVGNPSPPLYQSNHGPAARNVKRIWDFKDTYAPQCTTDTKNGINVGVNCNFSRDSLDVKHWYSPGKEDCYRPMLILRDSVWGCADSSSADLALQRPIAGKNTLVTPIVPGMIFSSPDCRGPEQTKSVDLANTRPSCARETFWVMWDSLCAVQSGNFNANWRFEQFSMNYDYTTPPCDTGGRVTVGLILRNGKDSSGNFCYDTAWYHHVFKFNDLNPTFTHDFNPAVSRCPGTTINFRVTDTTQDAIVNYNWSFDDGTPSVSGISMYKVSHVFSKAGTFEVILSMTNADGCTSETRQFITIGFEGSFSSSTNTICAGESIQFFDSAYYLDKGTLLWQTPARHAAGKETIWWDFGDGNGFTTGGHNPAKAFNKVGTYNVRLALKDSSGCKDTLTFPGMFTVYGTYADIDITDTLVCPQLYQLIDSSKIYDPLNYLNIPVDAINKWEWRVSPGNLKSFIQGPFFNFPSGGDYTIKLVVENTKGCKDSTTKVMNVKGPNPFYTIISDTLGCSPLQVTFDNQSTNANKYIWNFRDATNNTLTTLSDSNVTNVYEGGGLYKPFLTAESSEFDSKQNRVVTCRAVYPDTSNQLMRLIAVSGKPDAKFGNTNACSSYSLNFTDSSTIDSGIITAYNWTFGDGGTSTTQNPTHAYADTGTYTVTLVVFASSGCSDTIVKAISVAPPPSADFVYTENCHLHTTQFTDSSHTNNAYVVRWDWDFGDIVTSVLSNPTHQYALVGSYNVKLKILTNAGCMDSVTKSISIHPLPGMAFTATNTCQFINVPMVNTTSVTPGTLTYHWNFGNGDTSVVTTPSPIYNTHGNFNIKLIATSDKGCRDSLTQPITIYPRPTAQFSWNDTDICVNVINFFDFANTSGIASGSMTELWDFNDGLTATTLNATHKYAAPGIYTVKLTETSNFGCLHTFSRKVYALPKPTANFGINVVSQCLNTNNYLFTNSSTDTGALTYAWDFGDAGSSTATNPTHKYTAANTYDVNLIATNGNTCKDTLQKQVEVIPLPAPSFTINDTGQCVNSNNFIFTNTTTLGSGTYTADWDFGDGGTAGTTNTAHTYTKDSNYRVTMIATSNRGCKDTTSNTLTVFPKPTPKFAVNDSDQCINTNQYTFTNQSTVKYGTNTFVWKYGTGDSSAGTNGSYVYATDGNFFVTLKAKSNFDCLDTLQKQITVFPKPASSFTVNNVAQCFNLNNFIFTGTSTVKFGGLHYNWYFNNGESSTQKDTNIRFSAPGQYRAMLVAQSDYSCNDTSLKNLDVWPVPSVKFSINDTDQCLNENRFVFTSQSTLSSGNMNYQWTFGNEGNSLQKDPVFTFANDITHTVKLKVISDKLCTDSLSKQVIVFPKPNVAFTINDTGQCVNGNLFVFTGQSTIKYGVMSYDWNFDNGKTTTVKDTSIVYAAFGKYKPRLIVTSDNNCRDTLIKNLSVYAKPNPTFAVNDSDQCLKINNYIPINQSTIGEGVMTYVWHWRDGTTSTGFQPNHVYAADSTYTIKMVASSGFACKDSIERVVTVFPQPAIQFSINDSGQCVNDNLFTFTNASAVKYGSLNYNWNFGNGKTAVATDTSLVYKYDSTFRVVLRATTNFGCTDTLGRYVIVHSKPNPDFFTNDTDQCVNNNTFTHTNFTTIKQGSSKYNWDFGNGVTDSTTHAQITYTADTVYRVRLLATSDFGCKDSLVRYMLVFPKPIVGFTVNDSTQCININKFEFTNASTIKYGTLGYSWKFGNGDISNNKDPKYVYPKQGTFIVTLYAQSNNNCIDSALGTSILYPKPNPAFNVNDTDQCLGEKFIFTDASTIDSGTFSQKWRYSDGKTYDSVNVTRKFSNPGSYTSDLLLTSDQLCTDSLARNITVYPFPSPDFGGLKFFYCTDNPALPLFPVVPGGTFSGKNMSNDTFAPLITGLDTVNYEITVNGCKSDTVKYTRVFPLPVLDLGPDTTLCQREFLVFDITFPNSTYKWNDGLDVPKYRILGPGLYKVTLYHICDTLTDEINVAYRDYDCNYFFPNAFTPNRDDLNDVFLPYLEDAIEMRLQIFTRWGEKVFESTELTKGWDGTYKGELMPDGVYVWRIDAKFNESGYIYTHSTAGNLTLLR